MDLGALLRATHPIPATSVTLIAACLAAALGGRPAAVGWVLASTAAGQASVGWSNDYLDRERDAAAGRIEKPLVSAAVSPGLLRGLAMAAGIASPLLAMPLGAEPAIVMTAAVASAWLYNLWLKGTLWSWLPYAVSFGLLPMFAWIAVRGAPPPGWVIGSAALLGVAGHLMNVIPDLADERSARGLPHRLGRTGSLLAAALLLTGVLILALAAEGAWTRPGVTAGAAAAVLIVAAAGSVLRGRPRRGFHLTIAAAVAIGTVIVAARP